MPICCTIVTIQCVFNGPGLHQAMLYVRRGSGRRVSSHTCVLSVTYLCIVIHIPVWPCVQDGGVAGEGYQSRTSPHTKHELFVGLSLSLAEQVSLMHAVRRSCLSYSAIGLRRDLTLFQWCFAAGWSAASLSVSVYTFHVLVWVFLSVLQFFIKQTFLCLCHRFATRKLGDLTIEMPFVINSQQWELATCWCRTNVLIFYRM